MGCLKTIIILVPIVAIAVYFVDIYASGCWCDDPTRLDGKTVVITGANVGIGKSTARFLANRGARIIMACRSLERGNKAAKDIILASTANVPDSQKVKVMQLDLSSFESVKDFAARFLKEEPRLDILINNAGGTFSDYSLTKDGFETTFQVNHLSHFLLTNLLLDKIKQSAPSRIVSVSSIGHYYATNLTDDWQRREFSGFFNSFPVYFDVKLYNVMMTKYLGSHLPSDSQVTAVSLHPGSVQSNFMHRHIDSSLYKTLADISFKLFSFIMKTSDEGAQTSVYCAVAPEVAKHNGAYYSDCEIKEPNKLANDEKLVEKLWTDSMKMAKVEKYLKEIKSA